MVFVRKKRINDREYYFLVKSTRDGNTVKKTEQYFGLNKPTKEDIERFSSEMNSSERYLVKKQVSLDNMKNAYRKLITSSEDARLRYEKEFITRFTYDSSRIEGSTLSYRDTKLLLDEGIAPSNKPLRDIKESENHKIAFDYLSNCKKKIDIEFILELHRILKTGVTEDAGKFRNGGVSFGKYMGMNHRLIRTELSNLIRWYSSSEEHPLIKITRFHCTFERIHPFFDGNGRVGRLLINHSLKQEGYPFMLIQVKNKRRYCNSLDRCHDGNILYLLKLIVAELEKLNASLMDNST